MFEAPHLGAWCDRVAEAPARHRAGIEAALARQPIARRWVERQVRAHRISVQGIAVYYAGIVLAGREQLGSLRPLTARQLDGALGAVPEAGEVEQARELLLRARPADCARRPIVAAVFDQPTAPEHLPLRDPERVLLARVLCALVDALGTGYDVNGRRGDAGI